MLDTLQVLFWSLTYVLIIYNGIRYRQERPLLMPPVAGSLNLAWEVNALIVSKGFWGHIVWLALDVLIFAHNAKNVRNKVRGGGYFAATIAASAALWIIFRLPNVNGMLVSVFSIDVIMAMEYVWSVKRISPRGKVAIASMKLLGDAFAWLYYMEYTLFVFVTGLAVFVLNFYYLNRCLKEPSCCEEKSPGGR